MRSKRAATRASRHAPFALALLIAPIARGDAERVDRFLEAWAQRMRKVRTLRVRFRQVKTLRILRRPLVSQGLALVKKGRVLVVVRDPSGRVVSEMEVGPTKVRIHYPGLRRLEVYPRRGAPGSGGIPFPLFGEDVRALKSRYRIRLDRVRGSDRMTLVPRAAGTAAARIELSLVDFKVARYVQVDRRGDRVVIDVASFEVDPPVGDGEVRLRVPVGTRLVEPIGRPGR